MEEQQMLKFFASKQDLADLEYKLKNEMVKHKDEIMTSMDEQTGILRKLEQEMVFGFHRVDKLENRMDDAEADIANLKLKAAIA